MHAQKNKKIAVGIFIGLVISSNAFFVFPKKARAVGPVWDWITEFFTGVDAASSTATAGTSATTAINATTQTGLKFKDVAKDILTEIGRSIAKRVLAQMTEDTVSWINGGFEGKPLFLENPEAFYLDIRDQEIMGFTDAIGYDQLSFPYAKGFLIGFIQAQKNTVNNWAQSSLNRALSNRGRTLTEFAADFNVGGWDGWLQLTQLPQNNPWGFQIEATEDISRKLAGTVQSKADSVKEKLALGSGFLSPKICVDPGPVSEKARQDAQNKINQLKAQASQGTTGTPGSDQGTSIDLGNNPAGSYGGWSSSSGSSPSATQPPLTTTVDPQIAALQSIVDANTCKREEDTTPGTVVASQITMALGSSFRQSELGAALGNSLSAVFDALLNKFIDSGLSSLQAAISPEQDTGSDWSYYGETLGASGAQVTGTGSNWASGPDQPVILSVFKANVQKAIDNTSAELALYKSGKPSDPGIIEILTNMPKKVQSIDQCMPGPDFGWEERLKEEERRYAQSVMQNTDPDQEDAGDDDGMKAASKVINELAYAVDSFTNYIKDMMISEIPSAPLILDQLAMLQNNDDELRNFDSTRRKKLETLSRLKSIQIRLNTISTDPAPKSANEKLMLEQNVKYNSLLADISSDEDLNQVAAKLDTFRDRNKNIDDLLTSCSTERIAKGYAPFSNIPDFSSSGLHFGLEDYKVGSTGGSEKELFCGWPIEGGYSHGTFQRNTAVSYPNLPLVNGNDVFDGDDIQIDCNYIYPSSIIQYIKAGGY